jgi:transcription initiation factor TFIIIB Brf1 subunit/transcription initiation factor TFIIB
VAEDPGEIREAIEQTRQEIAETMQALGGKADVKARASDKIAEGKQLAAAKAGELRVVAEQAVPESVQPKVASAIDHAQSAGTTAAGAVKRNPAPAAVAGGLFLVLLMMMRRRRRRRAQWAL